MQILIDKKYIYDKAVSLPDSLSHQGINLVFYLLVCKAVVSTNQLQREWWNAPLSQKLLPGCLKIGHDKLHWAMVNEHASAGAEQGQAGQHPC